MANDDEGKVFQSSGDDILQDSSETTQETSVETPVEEPVQPEEETVQEEDTDAPQTTAKKYAGMYDTVEQLESGYKSLQREFTKKSQQNKDLLSQIRELDAPDTATTTQAPPPSDGPTPELIAKAYAQDPVRTMQLLSQYSAMQAAAPMQKELQNIRATQEVITVQGKYKDFDQFKDRAVEILKSDPYLKNAPNRLETAYKLAKLEAIESVGQTAYLNGVKQGAKTTLNKMTSSATSGGRTGGMDTPKTPEDELVDSILNSGGRRGIF